jgi:hypothetical protein
MVSRAISGCYALPPIAMVHAKLLSRHGLLECQPVILLFTFITCESVIKIVFDRAVEVPLSFCVYEK